MAASAVVDGLARLSLLTLNCLGVPFLAGARERLVTLAGLLNDSDFDVLCLQEVQSFRFLHLLRQLLSRYPYLSFERGLFAPRGGLLTLSRVPITRSSFSRFRTAGQLFSPALADRLLQKGVLTTGFEVAGAPVIVMNTHLLANYRGDWSMASPAARDQCAQLHHLARLVTRVGASTTVVVAGDLNVPRGSWLYHHLLTTAKLHDLQQDQDEPTYRPATFMPERYAQPIDFVLMRPGRGIDVATSADYLFREPVALTDGRVDYLSDHVALTARIELGASISSHQSKSAELIVS